MLNNRRPVVIAGITLIVAGIALWLIGDDNEVSGRNGMEIHSSSAWGEVLGFESDEDGEYAAARDKAETGETQQVFGILLGIAGLGTLLTGVAMRPARTKEV